ncbi:PIG-L family deacetylase [Sphingobacterium spiritivorum]|uniref:PIG-L family deacetylase n=1 Tax=Sphingobacterium spiritivorum TaxID=258 RepID=UPI003DA234F7
MIIRNIAIALCMIANTHLLYAQPALPTPSSEIKLKLEKLSSLGSVLYFAAHPDDENTRLIAWLAQEKKYRTAYLSLTRGDGGQNLIGTEIGKELGLIRTQELLKARSIDKGEQFFSTAYDFGFSKTYAETFDFWEKDEVLKEAVWIIRKFQPDVIITRFPPDERGGHGHHQASAILAIEAFKIAGDPKVYPEQLKYVKPWTAKRLLWNTFNFGDIKTTADNQFNLEIGDYNPLIGKSYGEIASESRSSHKSQGFGASRQRGNSREYFELLGGEAPETDLMDGVETSWKRVTNNPAIQQKITQLNQNFNISHPEASVTGLTELLQLVQKVDDAHWKTQKTKEIKELILDCAGIWIESYTDQPKFVLGTTISVANDAIVRRPDVKVELSAINNTPVNKSLPYNSILTEKNNQTATPVSQPYWLEKEGTLGKFNVDDLTLVGNPENPDALHNTFTLKINGVSVTFDRPVLFKYTHPVRGEVYEPLIISPAVTANIQSSAVVARLGEPKTVEILFQAHTDQPQTAEVSFDVPKNWTVSPQKLSLDFKNRETEVSQKIILTPLSKDVRLDSLQINIGNKAALSYHSIAYDHIPKITWFPPAKVRLTGLDINIPQKKVGYIEGAGDLVASSLKDIGISVTPLRESEIFNDQLQDYDAIIVGIRAFNVNNRMSALMPHLLKYVRSGGTLVEQYNVNNGLKSKNFGPYPFQISRDRVTDENATVQFDKESLVLQTPNKITAADFDGWIQERGLYFASQIDRKYATPLVMNDKNESPNNGSLLVVNEGKGKFVYTSLSFFRQLPAGVPGAYRLFVNLLSKQSQ